ncbi:MAG: rhamnulokinase [Planctomycetales bacterium]|nr:rhamnulokinase [Planctomycetales bacterium]
MNASRTFLAVDLGASSGRVLAGQFDGSQLALSEVHRFPNGPFSLGKHLYWDILQLWKDVQDGLRKANEKYGDAICSVAVDTWGVDFALLGRNDELLGNPYNYRDPQNAGMMELAFETLSQAEIFDETGLQFMQINSLYQLLAMRTANSSLLDAAETFLMIPDLFHFLLTGVKLNEFTDATTTQFLNPRAKQWSKSLLDRLNIPTDMLQEIAHPGTKIGKLLPAVESITGLSNVDVVLPGTHDTASAVMAVPSLSPASDNPDWAYISSGTWSLMGAEINTPIINEQAREFNFTNEGGIGGTIRLLKNITGLWLVQECQRVWAQAGRDYSWDQLATMAAEAEPLQSFIVPDDGRFVAPANMAETIRDYCRETNQPVPESEGAVIRCALESLALRYRQVLDMQETLTGSATKTIHIVGGGTQNRQLCQMTADACQRHVVTGPIEATAIGNLMVQAMASGDVGSVADARQIVKDSFDVNEYSPASGAAWNEAFAKFESLA